MSQQLRFAVLGIILTLTSLVGSVTSVGARWVRLGNAYHLLDANTCLDGISVSGAFTLYNTTDDTPISPNNYGGATVGISIYGLSSLTTQNGSQLKEGDTNFKQLIDQAKVVTLQDTTITFSQHDRRISIANAGGVNRSGCGPNCIVRDYANWYDTILINYAFIPDFNSYSYLVIVGNDIFGGQVSRIANHLEDCAEHGSNFTDSRVDAYEPWQSVAVFCEDKMVKVYGIDANANGYFAFAVTQDDIDNLGIPKENTLLASFPSAFGGKIRLYKLKDTGELQINAPGLPPESWKEYVFTWAGCT
ncbi:MAG: hypothetical protein GC179_05375 [Anaerolineaceae bacterium]|nr:hypothetical protein [Anaerolineaceae bacterium]